MPKNPAVRALNAESISAMKAARRGELVKAGKPDKLLRSLNEIAPSPACGIARKQTGKSPG